MMKPLQLFCLLLLGVLSLSSAAGLRGSTDIAVPEIEDGAYPEDLEDFEDEDGRKLQYYYRRHGYYGNYYNNYNYYYDYSVNDYDYYNGYYDGYYPYYGGYYGGYYGYRPYRARRTWWDYVYYGWYDLWW